MAREAFDPFPDPRESAPDGLVAAGGDWDPELVFLAYKKGIFPWPQPDMPILWFSPDPRGVLEFQDLHVSKSLKKIARQKQEWIFTESKAFPQVMRECRLAKRPNQAGTWILPEMEPAYKQLHETGRALSIECWEGEQLIGGIYGVLVGTYFSAESMFYKKANASKLCLLKLVEVLKRRGLDWMDIQMLTEVSQSMGGKMIDRESFLKKILERP